MCGAPGTGWQVGDRVWGILCDEHRAPAPAAPDRAPERFKAFGAASLHVPPEYANATLENFRPHGDDVEERRRQGVALSKAKAWLAAGSAAPPLVVLMGPPGTGKSHLGWSMIRAAVAQGVSGKATRLGTLLRRVRGAWGDGDGDPASEAQRLVEFTKPDVLLLDEVSSHAIDAKNVHAILYDVLVERLEWNRRTVITTNEMGDEALALFGGPLVSRITGCGGWWRTGGRDYRTHEQRAKRGGGE